MHNHLDIGSEAILRIPFGTGRTDCWQRRGFLLSCPLRLTRMEGGGGPSLELRVAVVLVKVVLDGLGGHGRGGMSLLHKNVP